MTITRQPLADSEENAWLQPLKAAGSDEEAIAGALARLVADPSGRASLVTHLADMAVLATDPTLTDIQRGRWLRRHFEPQATGPVPAPAQYCAGERPGGLMARLSMAREGRPA